MCDAGMDRRPLPSAIRGVTGTSSCPCSPLPGVARVQRSEHLTPLCRPPNEPGGSPGSCPPPHASVLPCSLGQEQWAENSLHTLCDSKTQCLVSESHGFQARGPAQLPLNLGPVPLPSPPLPWPTSASLSFRWAEQPSMKPWPHAQDPDRRQMTAWRLDASGSSLLVQHVFPEQR